MADLVIRMLQIAEERYTPEHEQEVMVDVVVTYNPGPLFTKQ